VFANNVKGIQVTFYWEGRPFIANFRLADRDGDQLYLSEPHEWSEAGAWERMPDHTGVLLRFDSDLQVLWLKNLDDYIPPPAAPPPPHAPIVQPPPPPAAVPTTVTSPAAAPPPPALAPAAPAPTAVDSGFAEELGQGLGVGR
jgi:hypothetical protein